MVSRLGRCAIDTVRSECTSVATTSQLAPQGMHNLEGAFNWTLLLPHPILEKCIGALGFFVRAILMDNSLNMIITYPVRGNVFFFKNHKEASH